MAGRAMDHDGPDALQKALTEHFGFRTFRPGQEAVCRAASAGRDVLIVMPTGAGKSLCYQLPAVARGGTALVISPLIALMEDQVAKLNQKGLKAERIHSGRTREQSRSAALAYRDQKLGFLFIAPERFSVAGFPEFLARHKPCLIAVDEAHCISQWGHDFRPDYRMLQSYLPMLRPAPIIGLTATATPVVQDDIAQQLGLERPLRSIQGFRRKNIGIEVVELSRGARRDAVFDLLKEKSRRPAIVYVPTRTESDELAEDLSRYFKTEPYHAGLRSDRRQSVQERFLTGETEIIVATIAFGMGIDKPDIRTVIHTALPGSIEAYYQEIGRAGRDGGPSRAILMHSYADRHRHDFFFARDYPAVEALDAVYKLLWDTPIAKEELQSASKLDSDTFEKSLDKLWIHGGAVIDPEENVARGAGKWRGSYLSQGDHRSAQLEMMLRYASSTQCRMTALVRHFGDRTDTQTWCGSCDFCAPEQCIAQQFRDATFAEERVARAVLTALQGDLAKSTGKLHAEICTTEELDRTGFEEVLASMARSGLVWLADAAFQKDGKNIPYRTVRLTREGEQTDLSEPLQLQVRRSGRNTTVRKSKVRTKASSATQSRSHPDAAAEPLLDALRDWRLAQAKSKGVPAFRIFTDKVLRQLVEDRPLAEEDLLAIAGVGPGFTKRYGTEILKIVSAFERS